MDTISNAVDLAVENGTTEFYEVVKTFKLVKGNIAYQFEILQNLRSVESQFSVSAYYEKDGVWHQWAGFPWIDRESIEGAIMNAVSFFRTYSVEGLFE